MNDESRFEAARPSRADPREDVSDKSKKFACQPSKVLENQTYPANTSVLTKQPSFFLIWENNRKSQNIGQSLNEDLVRNQSTAEQHLFEVVATV